MKEKIYYQNKESDMCMMCYKNKTTSMFQSEINDKESFVSIKVMKKKIVEKNIFLPKTATVHEIEDIYHNQVLVEAPYEKAVANTLFPIHSTSFFSSIEKDIVCESFFCNGFGFLSDRDMIPDKLVPDIVELFGTLATYKGNDSVISGSPPFHYSLPSIILDFAEKSRPSPGPAFKLLRSCIRHATDTLMPSIFDQPFKLFTCGSTVGITLQNRVPASMHSKHYKVKVAFSKNELLSCSCDCFSSGNASSDKVTCVHNLPLIFQLSELLHKGIAQHFLLDLASRWTKNIEEIVSKRKLFERMEESIIVLSRASQIGEEKIDSIRNSLNIADMLDLFQVGTQRQKFLLMHYQHQMSLFHFD